MNQTLLIRGLLSPAGHAAWTGIICAILWRERAKAGKININGWVIGAFVLAVVLHALWDIVNSQNLGAASYGGMTILSVFSLGVLFYLYREARKEPVVSIAAETFVAKT